jgi:aryl-alcohol dehydrogenase-like predicted oxidoreductase
VLSGAYPLGYRFGADDRRSRWPDGQIDAWIGAAQRAREVTTDGDLLRASLQFLVTAGMVPIPGMKSPEQVQRSVEACAATASRAEFDRLRHLWHDELTTLPPT